MSGAFTGAAVTLFTLCFFIVSRHVLTLRQQRQIQQRVRASQPAERPLAMFHTVSIAAVIWFVTLVAGVVAFARSGIMLSILLVASGIVANRILASMIMARRRYAYERAVPILLDQVARSIRSGASIITAFRDSVQEEHMQAGAGPVLPDLDEVFRKVDVGISFADAMRAWACDRPYEAVRLCVTATLIAHETGGSPASAIDGATQTIRGNMQARDAAALHATQSRASAMTLSGLPLILTGTMLIVHEHVREFLLHNPLGAVVIVLGVSLNALGTVWMNRMIKAALQ